MQVIQGFEDYTISRTGEVVNTRTGRVLKYDTSSPYRRVTLSKNGKTKRVSVHRLVAMHYIPNPSQSPQVNHINGDKHDNRVENLEWATCKENTGHAFDSGLRPVGSDHCNSTITNEQAHRVCSMLLDGYVRGAILTTVHGVAKHHVHDIRRRKTWTHVSCESDW